jgi:hypothetical protein
MVSPAIDAQGEAMKIAVVRTSHVKEQSLGVIEWRGNA